MPNLFIMQLGTNSSINLNYSSCQTKSYNTFSKALTKKSDKYRYSKLKYFIIF